MGRFPVQRSKSKQVDWCLKSGVGFGSSPFLSLLYCRVITAVSYPCTIVYVVSLALSDARAVMKT